MADTQTHPEQLRLLQEATAHRTEHYGKVRRQWHGRIKRYEQLGRITESNAARTGLHLALLDEAIEGLSTVVALGLAQLPSDDDAERVLAALTAALGRPDPGGA